jgi:NADH-quinone oxidoreductase subunit M
MEKYLILNTLGFPALSAVIFMPILGALLLLLFKSDRMIKLIALIASALNIPLSLYIFRFFNTETAQFEFGEVLGWIPHYNISYMLGIDGISVFLVLLTSLLTPVCVSCSWSA